MERDLPGVAQLLEELRGMADAFEEKRWRIVHRGCRRSLRKSNARAVLNSQCVITERDLSAVARALEELRGIADRFEEKLSQAVYSGRRR
jgi:hypothetical protein